MFPDTRMFLVISQIKKHGSSRHIVTEPLPVVKFDPIIRMSYQSHLDMEVTQTVHIGCNRPTRLEHSGIGAPVATRNTHYFRILTKFILNHKFSGSLIRKRFLECSTLWTENFHIACAHRFVQKLKQVQEAYAHERCAGGYEPTDNCRMHAIVVIKSLGNSAQVQL